MLSRPMRHDRQAVRQRLSSHDPARFTTIPSTIPAIPATDIGAPVSSAIVFAR